MNKPKKWFGSFTHVQLIHAVVFFVVGNFKEEHMVLRSVSYCLLSVEFCFLKEKQMEFIGEELIVSNQGEKQTKSMTEC